MTPAAADALNRLREHITTPHALSLRPDDAARVRQAADRLGAQLASATHDLLIIALAGGSGVGKSSLINALAGATIAEAAEQRPCTLQPTLYLHQAIPASELPAELTASARLVTHNRPELRFKILIDTPDLDSFATSNRAAARTILKAAGLVLYVFSPEKYWEERAWSVIRDERRFSASLAVLNKADLATPDELEQAAIEIRHRFAELGCPSLPILRISAARHIPRDDGTIPPPAAPIDEFPSLRAHIETELRDGDIARMRRAQRLRLLDHLENTLAQLFPPDLHARLDALESLAATAIESQSLRLTADLHPTLAAADLELRPQATLRLHRHFFGPFRAWLALADLLTITLPRLARHVRGLGGGPSPDLDDLLTGSSTDALDHAFRAWSDQLRDQIYAARLPLDRWRRDTASFPIDILAADLVRELRLRHGLLDASPSRRLTLVAHSASLVGWAIPMLLAAAALASLLIRLLHGQPTGGFDLLALVLTTTALAFTLLHGLTALALTGLTPPPANVGRHAIAAVLRRHFGRVLTTYREAIEADLDAIHHALQTLRALVETPGPVPLPPADLPTTSAELPPPLTRQTAQPTFQPDPAAASPSPAPLLLDSDHPNPPPTHVPTPPAPTPTTPAPSQPPEPETSPNAPNLSPAELFRQAVLRRSPGRP
ncbi:MAG: hypothetical protein KatS3mg108_3843 [Isosphaeraceae bacterium]|jgi:energy-coupling factor transporter ATP-binding protein EcfA2|nr:MAG: hypothetical protein KatS3mg108_3843 [Isosphaeraceae bacterium]